MAGGFMEFPDNDNVENIDIVDEGNSTESTEPEESGEDLVRQALEQWNNPDTYDEDEDEDDDSEGDSEGSGDTDEEESTEEKPAQDFKTPENAEFAERRRQAEQRKFEEQRKATPEYQLINTLAMSRGITPEQMLQEVQEAALRHQSEQLQVPVEYLRQQQLQEQKLQELENREALREYQAWDNRINTEAEQLKKDYPFLTDEEIISSKDLLLNTWRNVEAPLEQAVFALHGKTIAQKQLEASRNEVLAEVSGRKSSSIVPPKAGKSSNTPTLTDEEKYIAKAMNIPEDEYLKYKRR